MSTLSTRQTIFLVVLFVVTSLTFIALDNRAALDPLKTGLREVIEPVAEQVGNIGNARADPTAVEAELARVKAERDALAAENARLRVQVDEVEQLRELLKVQEQFPELTFISARVINPDPTNLQKFITLDKGSADGIEKGMAVVAPSFYIGQVTAVETYSARVTLLIDSTASVGAQLIETGAAGIVYGTWQQGGRAELRHVDRGTNPKDGEVVVTADASSTTRTAKVPPGLIIGKVGGPPVIDNQSDTLTIPILPVADFDNLEVVAVVATGDPRDA